MKYLPLLTLLLTASLSATENGLPVGRTGGFGEQTCSECHRPEPLNTGKQASVSVDVGPYVPGAKQRVVVKVSSASGNRWGFQLTARLASDNAMSAGVFEAVNQFTAVRCSDGSFGPCDPGDVTYMTHTSVGTAPGGQPGFKQFAFDWTPPGSDAGDVLFAVAGLAADGDKGTNSDLTATATATSKFAPSNLPTISAGGVVSAAALQRPDQPIASGEIISIFGAGLASPGTAVEVGVGDFTPLGLIPTSLARLSVLFKVPGEPADFLGRMLYVGDSQANLQVPDLPASATTASVQAIINRGGGASEVRGPAMEIAVQPRAPGLFTFGSSGVGPAAAVDSATGRPIAPASAGIAGAVAAQPGDVILLFGTGFGPTTPAFQAGQLADQAAPINGDVQVEIGGLMAEVLYAGAAPNFAGLMQFNVKIPDLPEGEHAVIIRVGGVSTQTSVIVPVG